MPSPAGRLTRALQHRNFRLFFGGQSVSLVGTWITRVATSWLVYRLTGSDLLVTQAASLVQSAVLAVLTFTNVITVKQIIWLQVVQGVINSFDTPARQAFVSEMVEDRRDLPNAIALNSSMVNGTRIIGPSIGGLLIAGFGEAWCFAADSISYIAVIGSIVAMRVPARARHEAAEMHLLDELHHGWRYVLQSVPIRSALLLVAIVSMAGTPYVVLMPAIAAQVLHGGPNTLGLLMAATGVGALAGALYLAQRESVLGLGRIIMWASVVFGIGLVVFSQLTSPRPIRSSRPSSRSGCAAG